MNILQDREYSHKSDSTAPPAHSSPFQSLIANVHMHLHSCGIDVGAALLGYETEDVLHGVLQSICPKVKPRIVFILREFMFQPDMISTLLLCVYECKNKYLLRTSELNQTLFG